jgi:hypothetical protein
MNPSPCTLPSKRRPFLRGVILILLATLGIAASEGPADITIYGRPMLTVSSAVVGPQAGKETSYPRLFDLTITVSNIGSITANHVLATVPDNEYVGAESGSAIFGFTFIYPGKSKTATLHMLLDAADPAGRVQPVIHFEYYSYDEEEDTTAKYTGDEPVRITFGETGWNHPALVIDSLSTDPEAPGPGDTFRLRIELSNISAGDAEQVLVRLGGTEGPKPFATLGVGNVGYIARIAARQTAVAEFPLVVDGAAAAGIYPIPVSLSFRNIIGEDLSDTQVVYLKVQNRPALQAGLIGELPSPILVGEPFDLSVEVINIGRQPINTNTIELTSSNLTLANASIYAGPLDESTSASLSATATAGKSGPADVLLTVHYLDEFNQPQTWTHTFQLTVEESSAAAEASEAQNSPSIWEQIWNAILAFLGFGG